MKLIAFLWAWVVVLLPVSFLAWAQDARLAKARDEKKVVVYNTTTVPDMQRIVEGFHKKYPFLEVESFRSNGERLLQKISTEVRAGRYLADAYIISGLQLWLLKDAGQLVPYPSPEREAVRKPFKDDAGYWAGVYFNLEVIGVNTRLTQPREMPKRWEDLLDPRWKGRMALEGEDIPWYASVLQILGEERAMDFFRKLAKQQLQMRNGHTLISQLLAAGEVALTPTLRVQTAETLKQKGAPVEWSAIEPIAANPPVSLALAKNAPHPNSARLFIDFVLSREGQTVIRGLNRNPTRGDVEQPVARAAKLKLFEMNWDGVVKNYGRYVKEFNDIFGVGAGGK
ncbi:MAG: extracellular solute-binding protein [Deltaproteobacteria bacterium]|nr:extracellular solute-binding protein [Deltaproteobacteria bacterium]